MQFLVALQYNNTHLAYAKQQVLNAFKKGNNVGFDIAVGNNQYQHVSVTKNGLCFFNTELRTGVTTKPNQFDWAGKIITVELEGAGNYTKNDIIDIVAILPVELQATFLADFAVKSAKFLTVNQTA